MCNNRTLADICPLLEVDDMVRFQKPDWKCVFTYVQSFYRRFRNVPLEKKCDSKEAITKTENTSTFRPSGSNELVRVNGPTFSFASKRSMIYIPNMDLTTQIKLYYLLMHSHLSGAI